MIRLAENFDKSSICSDNNRDLEGISKTQLGKATSSFPFTTQNIVNEISEKDPMPSNFATSSKSNSITSVTDNINNVINAHSKDSNIAPKLPPKPKHPKNQILTIALWIHLFRHNR